MKYGRLALGIMLLAVVVGILFLQPDGPSTPEASSARSQDGSSQKTSGRQVETER